MKKTEKLFDNPIQPEKPPVLTDDDDDDEDTNQ